MRQNDVNESSTPDRDRAPRGLKWLATAGGIAAAGWVLRTLSVRRRNEFRKREQEVLQRWEGEGGADRAPEETSDQR